MSNSLILTEDIYHRMLSESRTLNDQFGRDSIIPQAIPNRVVLMLSVFAVVGDSCVEFLKNRYTGDRIMSLEEFEIFKQKYLK